ncbi:MAG: septal ring lytic transglycosylase RlpA family protein [Pseudomonadota bacterium]
MSSEDALHRSLSRGDSKQKQYVGHYKIGKTYTVNGKAYKPEAKKNHSEIGLASWYGKRHGFHGKKTANGDKYNKDSLTAAHPTLPLPSMLKVTNLANNKSLIVMANDRGPFRKDRILDVSEQSAVLLGFKQQGVAKVKVQYLHKETQELLDKLALKPKCGSVAKKKMKTPRCSVNCHIKLVNMQHKLSIKQ